MEGPLSPTAWLMMLAMSAAGAWMYFVVRPYPGHWSRLVGMVVVSAVAGAGITPALCEFYSLTSVYQHMLVAFFSSLLSMPVCRGAVAVAESETVKLIKEKLFGARQTVSEDEHGDKKQPADRRDGGGD